MKELKVGRIPSLTWNRLDVNEGKVTGDLTPNTVFDLEGIDLPAGASHRMLTAEEAGNYIAENAPEETPEYICAGKTPIWHPQKFATGLGPDVDAWFVSEKADFLLIETEENRGELAPVLLDLQFKENNQALLGQIIHIRKGTEAAVIIRSSSEKRFAGLVGIQTKILVDEGASLHLVKIQALGRGFTYVDDTGCVVGGKGRFKLTQLNLGGKNSFLGVQTEEVGDRAEYTARLGFAGTSGSKTDISYNTVQRGRKTKAHLIYDGVLWQDAKKSLRGTIDFRRGSSESTGDEQENVLLLSEQVENKSLPVILCEEEDVEGRHGASIGQLDEDVLFYMAARGIPAREAEKIMVRSKLGAVADQIPDAEVRAGIRGFIEGGLGG